MKELSPPLSLGEPAIPAPAGSSGPRFHRRGIVLRSNESGSPWRRALGRTVPALCVAAVVFLAEPTGAVVQLVRGPYLQNGTSSSIVVRWRTDSPSGSRVLYGSEPGSHATTFWDPTPTTEHIVTVAGLEPGERYYYAVGTADEVLAGDDPDHFFFAAPAPGTRTPIRVWVVGDSGTGDENALAVRDAYETFGTGTRTDLWLMLGDNALPAGTDLDHQVAMFDIYSGMLRTSVLWPTLGDAEALNADSATQSGPYFDVFTLPDGSSTEAYYSFDFANVHFVALDSSTSDRTPSGPMAMWLSQDLATNAADWTVVFWHHAPYSKGLYDSDVENEMIEMRESFVPILETHGVDLVLSGHSHGYERTFLINGHHADSTTFSPEMQLDSGDGSELGDGAYTKALSGPVPGSGTVYVVAGSSGQAVSRKSRPPRGGRVAECSGLGHPRRRWRSSRPASSSMTAAWSGTRSPS